MKPQDVLVLVKLALLGRKEWTYAQLADELQMSPSQVHASVRRAMAAGLILSYNNQANTTALTEFINHGLRYVFPAERGAITRGMPTAHSASPLSDLVELPKADLPLVWPDPDGTVRGEEFKPLSKYAVSAAKRDPEMYKCLALIDAIRGGRARERNLAQELLPAMLQRAKNNEDSATRDNTSKNH